MTCPICAKETAERYRPFCSRRCSDVDLGRWLTGSYVVPGPEGEDVSPQDDSQPPTPPAIAQDCSLFLQTPLDSPDPLTYQPATPRMPIGALIRAQIAQSVEQRIENPRVAGSIPALGTI